MSLAKMRVVPRHCHTEDDDRCFDTTFNKNVIQVDGSPDHSDCDLNIRKKMRSVNPPVAVSPSVAGDEALQREASPPRQWWFSRTTTKTAPTQQQKQHQQLNSGMILTDHLGSTSDVVESLTHDVENWSLTRISQKTAANPNATNNSRKKEKQRRSKEAQRQVRMARRRCLEARQHLRHVVSSTETMN